MKKTIALFVLAMLISGCAGAFNSGSATQPPGAGWQWLSILSGKGFIQAPQQKVNDEPIDSSENVSGVRLAPDGTYVAGKPTLAPDGTYVGGKPTLAPDGTYVAGRPQLAPDGTYVGGSPRLAPDGSYVGGTPILTPNGSYAGTGNKLPTDSIPISQMRQEDRSRELQPAYAYRKIVEQTDDDLSINEVITKCVDLASCNKYLNISTERNVVAGSKECLTDDERINNIFGGKQTGEWYCRMVIISQDGHVSDNAVIWQKERTLTKKLETGGQSYQKAIAAYFEGPKKAVDEIYFKSAKVYIVSPDGKVDTYDLLGNKK